MDLLRGYLKICFVLTTTYFLFIGNIYEQRFSAVTGSSVYPIVPNLYIEFIEYIDSSVGVLVKRNTTSWEFEIFPSSIMTSSH